MGKINVCIATDDKYAKHCGVVITSALKNAASRDELHFYILDGGLSKESAKRLKNLGANVSLIEIDKSIFKPYEVVTSAHWALPTLFRLKMPSVLSQLDKVIYLDCDVVVNASLNDFFNLDIDNFYIAAVNDYSGENSAKRIGLKDTKYFNAGVTLVNLASWRKNNIEEKCFDYLEKNYKHLKFGDQDVMNFVLEGSVYYLDQSYNYIVPSAFQTKKEKQAWEKYRNLVKIIHYAGQKPWEIYYKNTLKDEYWKYYILTPWEADAPYEKFKKAQNFANFRPFLIFRFIKRYPFFPFIGKTKEFLRFFK